MVVTWEEAIAESRAEGKSQGRAEGEVVAKQEDSLLVVNHRFPTLPIGFGDRIRAISDLDRLNDLFEQLLKTESIDDLDLE